MVRVRVLLAGSFPQCLPGGEELGQRWCEVFGGYPVPGAGQETRGSVRKRLGYSLDPGAQLVSAGLAAGHEGGGADRGEPFGGMDPVMRLS